MASADVEGAFHCIKHVDVERALLQKGFILFLFVLCYEHLVTSREE